MSTPTLKARVEIDDQATGKLKSVGSAAKDLVKDFSGIATGVFNLYNSFDRLETANLQVQKSQLAVQRATESVNDAHRKQATLMDNAKKLADDVADAEANLAMVQGNAKSSAEDVAKAQEKLNKAHEKLVANKSATEGAVKDIELAEEALRLKTEQAEKAADDQKQAIINSAIQAVPAIITIADKVWALKGAWDAAKAAATAATAVSTASSVASGAAGAVGGAAAAGGASAALAGAGMVAAPAAAVAVGVLAAGYGYGMQEQAKKDAAAEYASIAAGKMPAPNITHPNGLNQAQLDEYKKMFLEAQKPAAPKQIYRPGYGWVTVPGAAEGAIVGPNNPQLAMVGEGGEREFVSPESMLRRAVADGLKGAGNRGNIQISMPITIQKVYGVDDLERVLDRRDEKIVDNIRRVMP